MQQQLSTNGHDDEKQVRDELDMYGRVLRPSQSNSLLTKTNLGLGRYDDDYLWQQIRSYRKGLYAYIAFGRILSDRAVYETQIKLAREGYVHYSQEKKDVEEFDPMSEDEVSDDESRWTAERRYGKQIWKKMGDSHQPLTAKQAAAVIEKTNVDTEWLPIYWEMVAGRHEASRSINAELLRDVLTAVNEVRGDGEEEKLGQLIGGT